MLGLLFWYNLLIRFQSYLERGQILKKISKIISVLFAFLLLVCLYARPAQADVSYEINNLKVHAKVNRHGSLSMTRQVDYYFDSDARGLYYRQNLNKNQKLTQAKVMLKDKQGKLIELKPGSGENNSYELTKDTSGYRFKVYHRIFEDDKVSIIYQYKISNAVINWQDTAELNFKIIGNNWDTDLDHVTATIDFSNGKTVPSLKAWAHGPLTGNIKVSPEKGRVILSQNDLAGDVGIELHAIFPTSLTAKNQNIRNEKHRQKIISQEIKLAKEANRKRQNRRIISRIYTIVSIAISGIITLFSTVKYFHNKKRPAPLNKKDIPHNFEIPSVDPVTAIILDTGKRPAPRAFGAYLTQLAGKRQIKISQTDKKSVFEIKLLKPEILEADPFLKHLFTKVGDGKSFTTKELQKADLLDEFTRWQDRQYNKLITGNLFDQKALDSFTSSSAGVLSANFILLFLWIIGLTISFTASAGVLILALLNLFFTLKYNKLINYYTSEGILATNQVRGFVKMLDDIGNFKTKDIGELIFWEGVMPYAVAFGLAKKVIAQLRVDFSSQDLDPLFVYYPIFMYDTNISSFDNSINTALYNGTGSNSSLSGNSGGFSVGSSGGFGGGSGGGAF